MISLILSVLSCMTSSTDFCKTHEAWDNYMDCCYTNTFTQSYLIQALCWSPGWNVMLLLHMWTSHKFKLSRRVLLQTMQAVCLNKRNSVSGGLQRTTFKQWSQTSKLIITINNFSQMRWTLAGLLQWNCSLMIRSWQLPFISTKDLLTILLSASIFLFYFKSF